MNCQTVRRRLLGSERPEHVSAALRDHLAQCAPCREWQRTLVQVEQSIGLLPVPRSAGKTRLLDRLAREKLRPVHGGALTVALSRSRTLAAGLAAALLLAVAGWWAWWAPETDPAVSRPPAADPLLASLLQRYVRLARTDLPRERVEALADLADDLQTRTRTLAPAAAAEDLTALAQLYERVVSDGVVERARALPADQRLNVLPPISERLARAGRQAQELAQEAPPASAAPLLAIAAAARDGDSHLRGLLQRETP
jgi:hypothetical protein